MAFMHIRYLAILAAVFAGIAIAASGLFSGPNSGAAYAQADPCSTANIAQALRRDTKSLSGAEGRQFATWCKQQEDIERKAAIATRSGSSGTAAKGAVDLKSIPKSQAIICGKNACACWKGNVWNGCHHTETLCAGALHCVSKVCGCQAK